MKNLISAALLIFSTNCTAADSQATSITRAEMEQVVSSTGNLLKTKYVFSDKAEKMAALIEKNYTAGKYARIKNAQQLAAELQQDIRSIYDDKHIRIRFSPKTAQRVLAKSKLAKDSTIDKKELSKAQFENFGFNQLKILPGNLGYLDLRNFSDTAYASDTAAAAMAFLSNTNALIIDLRRNGGGSASMIQFISSYFFDDKPVHLGSFYWRPEDKYTDTYTLTSVPGKRIPDTDIYILISGNTFSAAEGFSYDLKHLERATLIGENTGGGAHPGETIAISDQFTIWMPSGRAINPITKTNWQDVGVIPHVKISAAKALLKAQVIALEKLAQQDNEMREIYQWHLTAAKAELAPVKFSHEELRQYEGKFGFLVWSLENGSLYSKRKGEEKRKLEVLDTNLFRFQGGQHLRFKVLFENNKIIGIQEIFKKRKGRSLYKSS
ncbi:MAG: S41 family peptidase [Kangiellaceae bacterium]|nr:S41 family peptidase [Kangiellaceae bacterium]MCW9015809.1 S41 family peptidase [Kangiellaceae bacterium]